MRNLGVRNFRAYRNKKKDWRKLAFLITSDLNSRSFTVVSLVDRVARYLSWLECKRSWVRVSVGSCTFSSPVTFGGSVCVRARAASSKGTFGSVPAWFWADSGTNLFQQGDIVADRPCGSVAKLARVLARYARGPGFESRSGHVFFPPLW